jgi:hypothetical protein
MRLLLLLGVAVFTLCSRDAMAQTFGEEPTPETVETMVISCKADALEELTQDGERDALRAYVSQLDVQIQSQIEDIESLVSSEVVQR